MIDKQYVINNVSNIEKLPNVTILKMLMQFKEQLETSGAYHSITIGEVTTLEAEENAYVENVGTSTDLVLNFGIPKGVGFNFSGEWVSDDNEYYPNDVVLYNGNLYICISTILDSETPPNIDTTHWSLFVGYGNDISEFVTSEYDKQSNLLPLENKEYNFEAKSQYGFVRVPLGQDYTLKAGTYVLDFKMKVGSDTGVFNKFSFDYGTTSKFVVGTQSSVSTSYSNINRTFTLSEDITYNAIWIQVAKIGNYTFKEVFVGKKFNEYQPYNSASHITNAQADLLKSEREKSLNLFNENSVLKNMLKTDGSISSNSDWRLSPYIKVKSGKDYTFSWKSSSAFFQVRIGLYDANKSFISCLSYENANIFSKTFTPTNGTLYIRVSYSLYVSGSTVTREQIMLNEGTEVLPYQEWNGSIIHEKDIEPVLLWKNGSSNTDFLEQDITVNDLNEYDKVTVVYKVMAYSDSLPLEMTFDIEYGSYSYLIGTALDALGTLLSRAFEITNNTTIRFGSGNRGSATGTNNFCIPVAVYGVK